MPATIQIIETPKRWRAWDTSSSEQIVSQNLFTGNNSTFTDGVGDWIGHRTSIEVDSNTLKCTMADPETGSPIGIRYNNFFSSYAVGTRFKIKFKAKRDASTTMNINFNYAGDLSHITDSDTIKNPNLTTSFQDYEFNFTYDYPSSNDTMYIGFQHTDSDVDSNDIYYMDDMEIYKLESFGNNNHGQIYSGRGLEFDGVTDYLDAGDVVDMGTNSLTLALWAKGNTSSVHGSHLLTKQENYNANTLGYGLYWRHSENRVVFNVGDGSDGTRITYDLEANTWYRFVGTYNSSTGVGILYVNGVQVGTATDTDIGNLDNSENLKLGGTSVYFDGMMSDAQVWDAAWSADDVAFDYANPEQLALNRGGTSLTNSNLKLWYPMNDGHRGQQSYVLDASNTGPVAEQIADTDFANALKTDGTSSSQWYSQSVDGTAGAYGWSISNGVLSNDGTYDTSDGLFTYARINQVDGADENAMCKVTVTIDSFDDNAHCGIGFRSPTTGNDTVHSLNTLGVDSPGTYTFIRRIKNAGVIIYTKENYKFAISHFSVKRINDKNHATTVFYGDNTIVAGNNDIGMGGTNNWDAYGTGTTESVTGGKLRVVTTTAEAVQGVELPLANSGTPVVGRTYRIRAKLKRISGLDPATIHIYYGGVSAAVKATDGSPSNGEITDSEEQYEVTLTATDATGKLYIVNLANTTALTFEIDAVYLKEVGIASGWTDADQQLDIPQTALQSYNQLAWWKENSTATEADASTEYITIVDGNSSTYTAESVSFWFITNNSEEQVLLSGLMNITSYGSIVIGGDNDAGKISCAHNTGATNKCETDTTWHDGKWHHCTVIKLASDASPWFDIYVDGEKQSVTAGSGAHRTSDKTLVGARHSSGYFHKLDGCITEISAWNVVLTQAEVNELYNDGKALNALEHSSYTSSAGNLEGYWRNNGLAAWTNLKDPGTNDGTVSAGLTETILQQAGVDSSRDCQGFLMNRQKDTNALNLPRTDSGAGAYVSIEEKTYDVNGTAHSFDFWYKPHQLNPTGQVIMGESSTGDYNIIRIDNGVRLFVEGVTNDHWARNDSAFTALTPGDWYHFVAVFNGDKSVVLYKDGATLGTVAYGTGGELDKDIKLSQIGKSGNANHDTVGEIDDLKIYESKALSAAEVKRNYNAGKRSHRNPV